MKRKYFTLILLAALLLASLFAARLSAPESEGEKHITVAVEHLGGETREFNITTDAVYLRAALEEAGLIAGEEREYGLWVMTVDGESADESAQQWWGYTVNGETAAYGVESQPITDGDRCVFTLHEGW